MFFPKNSFMEKNKSTLKKRKIKPLKSNFFKKSTRNKSKNIKSLKKNDDLFKKNNPPVIKNDQILPKIKENSTNSDILSKLIKYISSQTNIKPKEKNNYILFLEKLHTKKTDINSSFFEYITQRIFES